MKVDAFEEKEKKTTAAKMIKMTKVKCTSIITLICRQVAKQEFFNSKLIFFLRTVDLETLLHTFYVHRFRFRGPCS